MISGNKKNLKIKNFDDYLIAIRAYNEGENLSELIDKIIKEGFSNILIVDDASTDNTKEIVFKLKKKYRNKAKIYYVRHLINLNMGAALLTQLKIARLMDKHLITLDGDLQHNPKDIKKFLIVDRYDLVLGNRYKGEVKGIPLFRKLLHYLNTLFNFILSFKKVSDIHNGFRAYNKKILGLIEKNLIYFDGAYADNLFHIIVKLNLNFKEVPVEVSYTKSSMDKGQKVNRLFLKILIKSILLRFFKKKLWLLSMLLTLIAYLPILIMIFINNDYLKNTNIFSLLALIILSFFLNTIIINLLLSLIKENVINNKNYVNFISELSIKKSRILNNEEIMG